MGQLASSSITFGLAEVRVRVFVVEVTSLRHRDAATGAGRLAEFQSDSPTTVMKRDESSGRYGSRTARPRGATTTRRGGRRPAECHRRDLPTCTPGETADARPAKLWRHAASAGGKLTGERAERLAGDSIVAIDEGVNGVLRPLSQHRTTISTILVISMILVL
ncbi:MAG: hypothetical protein PHQ28_04575 [Mycobacterium sp.]|nr:hypothetical protein [Mycobacterium sp.]